MYRTPALSIAFRVHLVKARGRSRSIPQTSLSFANAKDIPRSQSHFAPEPAPHSMVSLGSSAFDLGVGVFPPFHSKGERNKEGSRDAAKKLSTEAIWNRNRGLGLTKPVKGIKARRLDRPKKKESKEDGETRGILFN
ncbi:hypothetical protein M9H77_16370 [Catharanthus roseus]|uniref:Uncharacterized protein n=1 Tax=Catharanthus roseus TaxID=4058 RepID=A0ACC0B1P5_CATRO|nr:hypothetical protein M9H77_00509 [Catharanthus roseus]KAI5639602.1 hypothetical protein M9H77_00528 [Catharanthus roseus]KAI5666517.1 hypothetical protein M9H77_16370 [Catharanthus roseus]